MDNSKHGNILMQEKLDLNNTQGASKPEEVKQAEYIAASKAAMEYVWIRKFISGLEMWEAIKSRFGGNNESKKMQKYILKQQFEGFSVSNSEGLHKGYDRFQSLLSQLEIHGTGLFWTIPKGKDLLSYTDGSCHPSFPIIPVASTILDHEDLEQTLMSLHLEEMDFKKWASGPLIFHETEKFYKKIGKEKLRCLHSPHSTVVPSDSDNENTFSSTNILNYFPASSRNISPNSSEDFTKYLLDILLFPPLHDDPYIQAYDVIPPSQVIIALPAIVPPSMSDSRDFFPPKEISSPEGAKTPVKSPNPMSMPPKRTSTSAAPAMTQDAIRQLVKGQCCDSL
ncbi:hypothetical protein Tco_0526178 [Tanacetum coccineum]